MVTVFVNLPLSFARGVIPLIAQRRPRGKKEAGCGAGRLGLAIVFAGHLAHNRGHLPYTVGVTEPMRGRWAGLVRAVDIGHIRGRKNQTHYLAWGSLLYQELQNRRWGLYQRLAGWQGIRFADPVVV